mmetsp:Transcript_137955/g.195217  ORF Transcript_137955/g.195217 Transcript_137955/m.195217 type:complete len:346 (-) Transcript_137955:640-1677(-)
MLNGSGEPHGGCGSCHWNGSFLLNGSFLPKNASFLRKHGSSRLQRHQQRQRHLQRQRRLLHLHSPADCGCSTRPSWGQTNRCANSSVRHGSHMEASRERPQQHAQLASSKHRSPAHASKPCHSQHPPKVGLAPRSLCHALSSTNSSWMATMLGRSCSRRHCSQKGLCRRHELGIRLPGWSNHGRYHTPPAPCCRPIRSRCPLHQRHDSWSSGCGQCTWMTLLHDGRSHRTSMERRWCGGSPSGSCCSTSQLCPMPRCVPRQKCSGTSRSPCSADGSTSPSWNLTNPASNWRSQHRSHRYGLPHGRHRPQKRECEGGSCRARFLGIPCFCGHSTKTSCVQTIQSTS